MAHEDVPQRFDLSAHSGTRLRIPGRTSQNFLGPERGDPLWLPYRSTRMDMGKVTGMAREIRSSHVLLNLLAWAQWVCPVTISVYFAAIAS